MKLFAKNLMFALASTMLFATAAQAGCLEKYEATFKSSTARNNGAIVTGVTGGAAAGGGMYTLMGGMIIGNNVNPALTIGAGAAAGGGTSVALRNNTEDLERMVGILRDVKIGQGLALNGVFNEVNSKTQVSREQVTKMIKDADESGALCNGEDLVSPDELIKYLVDLSK